MTKESEEQVKARLPFSGTFEFRTAKAASVFDYLTKAFILDYMTKSLAQENSGWRSLGDIAKDLHVSTSIIYAKKRNQLSSPVKELVERGLVERRFFQRERGRGGEVMRLRIAYGNELVKNYLEQRIRGVRQIEDAKVLSSKMKSYGVFKQPTEEKSDKIKIAVLPFVNISPDPSDEYFADGMTVELISTLSKISRIQVISRTSVMGYRQTRRKLPQIASELNVGYILEGSVRKIIDQLRITIQLIDVASQDHLWSEDYDRKFENVFELQREIALKVAESLEVSILDKERGEMRKRPTQNLEAYILYLKGRTFKQRRTLDSFNKTVEYCMRAIDKDPDYAQAYAELALNYALIGYYELLPSQDVFAQATRFAEKAIQLDDSIAESHIALGLSLFFHKWRFQEAQNEFRRAVSLNPSLADAHLWFGVSLIQTRRFDEAISEAKRALELDPLSAWTQTWLAAFYLLGGKYDEAIELFNEVLESDPNSAFAHDNLGCTYIEKSMYAEAISEIKKSRELGRGADALADLAHAYAKMGKTDEVRNILEDLLRRNEKGERVEVFTAAAYVSLGDFGKALEWLERAFQNHHGFVPAVNTDHTFDDIRGDPRFKALLKRIGL